MKTTLTLLAALASFALLAQSSFAKTTTLDGKMLNLFTMSFTPQEYLYLVSLFLALK